MRILIVYGTTEGQTAKIADWIADRLEGRGHEIKLVDSARAPGTLSPEGQDAVIVAASVHQYRHQAAVSQWVRRWRETLNAMPSLFLSVSLSAVNKDDRPDAQKIVNRFLNETDWRPTTSRLVAGALKYSQYDFFKRQMMRLIAWREGGPTDTAKDVEFTDWEALGKEVDAFIDRAARKDRAA